VEVEAGRRKNEERRQMALSEFKRPAAASSQHMGRDPAFGKEVSVLQKKSGLYAGSEPLNISVREEDQNMVVLSSRKAKDRQKATL
jgi:hypothetical protein